MYGLIAPVLAVLSSAAIIYLGNGLQGLILPLRGTVEDFGTAALGLLGSGYSAGFVIGCLLCPRIIRRVGHIRTFAVLASLAASVVLLHVMIIHPIVWLLLRVGSGLCLAGMAMILESWLNERATNETRGRVFSIYLVVNFGAVTIGQMIVATGDPAGFVLFALCAMAITLALVPVGLTSAIAPSPPQHVQLRLLRLYRTSPVGVLACLGVGVANGAFGALGAVYAQRLGLGLTEIALFMSVTILGGALAQYPLGWISDRVDRRFAIIGCSIASAVVGFGLAVAGAGVFGVIGMGGDMATSPSPWLLIAIATAYGAFAFPLYGLCVAHTNDYVDAEDFVEASGGLLLLWGAGAVIGPIFAAVAMANAGPGGLFFVTLVTHVAIAGFAAYRVTQRSTLPSDDKDDFVAAGVIRPSPAAAVLDPRAPDPEETDGSDDEGAVATETPADPSPAAQ